MDHFSAALQFPYYFGENWPALNECVCEIDWMPLGRGVVVAISGAATVLSESPDQLVTLVEILNRASDTYAQPIALGEHWDRPAVPFHVVLQGTADELAGWERAGALLAPLE